MEEKKNAVKLTGEETEQATGGAFAFAPREHGNCIHGLSEMKTAVCKGCIHCVPDGSGYSQCLNGVPGLIVP